MYWLVNHDTNLRGNCYGAITCTSGQRANIHTLASAKKIYCPVHSVVFHSTPVLMLAHLVRYRGFHGWLLVYEYMLKMTLFLKSKLGLTSFRHVC